MSLKKKNENLPVLLWGESNEPVCCHNNTNGPHEKRLHPKRHKTLLTEAI